MLTKQNIKALLAQVGKKAGSTAGHEFILKNLAADCSNIVGLIYSASAYHGMHNKVCQYLTDAVIKLRALPPEPTLEGVNGGEV